MYQMWIKRGIKHRIFGTQLMKLLLSTYFQNLYRGWQKNRANCALAVGGLYQVTSLTCYLPKQVTLVMSNLKVVGEVQPTHAWENMNQNIFSSPNYE